LPRIAIGSSSARQLAVRDVAVVAHPAEHVDLAGPGLVEVAVRRVLGRRGHQAGQQRGLGHGDVLDLLAEVGLGGGGDAVGVVAEEDVVQIDRQDVLLGQLALDAHREDQLLGLADVRALVVEQEHLR
jgi:hypothetical protein